MTSRHSNSLNALSPADIKALRAQLGEIPGRYAIACGMATAKAKPDEARPGKPGSRPPLNLSVVHLADTRRKPGWHGASPDAHPVLDRYGTLPALESWTRLIRDELTDAGLDWPDLTDTPTVAGECAWIVETLPFCLTQLWVTELADDVRSLHRQLGHVAGIRPDYRPSCREVACGWRLDPMDNGTWYACPACGRDYTIDADLRALGQVQEMTLGEISAILGVPERTLRRWHAAGLLEPVSGRKRGRRFDLGAARRAAASVQGEWRHAHA